MKQLPSTLLTTAFAILFLAIAVPALAFTTISYTMDGTGPMHFPGPITPPANAPWGPDGYPGDTIEFEAYTGTLDLIAGTYVKKINKLKWLIDYTYAGTADDPDDWSDLAFNVDGTQTATMGSTSGSLSQGGLLEVTWDNDFLQLYEGMTTTFVTDGFRIDVTPLALERVGGSNFSGGNPWAQPDRDVMARFDLEAVPEPSTMMTGSMLLTALGAAKLLLRRRRGA